VTIDTFCVLPFEPPAAVARKSQEGEIRFSGFYCLDHAEFVGHFESIYGGIEFNESLLVSFESVKRIDLNDLGIQHSAHCSLDLWLSRQTVT